MEKYSLISRGILLKGLGHKMANDKFFEICDLKKERKKLSSQVSIPISSPMHINHKGKSASKTISRSGPSFKKIAS